MNADGGYRCSPACPPGFRPRTNSRFKAEETCEDLNECSLGLHTCNTLTHYCLNTNGSYACEALTTIGTTTTGLSRISTSSATTPRMLIDSRYNRVQVSRSILVNIIDSSVLQIRLFNCYLYFRILIVIGPRNHVD